MPLSDIALRKRRDARLVGNGLAIKILRSVYPDENVDNAAEDGYFMPVNLPLTSNKVILIRPVRPVVFGERIQRGVKAFLEIIREASRSEKYIYWQTGNMRKRRYARQEGLLKS